MPETENSVTETTDNTQAEGVAGEAPAAESTDSGVAPEVGASSAESASGASTEAAPV